MERKSYWTGFFTSWLIILFIGGCGLCIWLIFGIKNETKEQSIVDVDQSVVSSTTASALETDGESVLSDTDFVEKIMYLENIIDIYYVDDVDNQTIKDGILDGIMDSLGDAYADYYTYDEIVALYNDTEGIYYGIGVYIMKDTETLYPQITGIIKDSPAQDAGLCADDYICCVDGEDVYDMDLSDVVALIKGEEGTTVTLTIVREATEEEFDVEVERRKVESPTVNYTFYEEDKIAYIQITEFATVTVDQFKEAMSQADADKMEGLILDLRGNPGGSLTAVVDIANQLLPKGLVVYTEDKYGTREEYPCTGENELQVPLVVLINGGSASASEILSGAIKDYGIGTLLGTTTYGKGIVQRVITLPDYTGVKLTASHYYTPNGNDIHKVGIEPDEYLELDVEAYLNNDGYDNQLERAKEILRAD